MFVRYEVASTNTTSALFSAMMTDIAGIFNGTITSTSGFNGTACNIGLSSFTGTIPSGYSVATSYLTPGGSYNNYINIQKSHNSASGASRMCFNLSLYVGSSRSSSAFRFGNQAAVYNTGTNVWPGGTLGYQTTGGPVGCFDDITTSYSSPLATANSNIYTTLSRILIWANTYNCVIQCIFNDGTMTTGGLFDYEASASDTYAYGLNSMHAPQIYMTAVGKNMTGNSPPASSATSGIAFGRGVYLQANGSMSTTMTAGGTANLDLHYGNQGNTTSFNGPTIYPLPRFSQPASPMSSGSNHYITPVYLLPGFNGGPTQPTSFGKLPNFYRTTDDIADSGEIISDGTTSYAVLRLHKTKGYGTADYANQTPNACYLIPV